jgi:peptide/nickel transport system permease protein
MGSYIARRLALVVPTLLIVSLVVFSLIHLVPGDPAVLIVGDAQNTELLAQTRASLGLDQPLPVQFFNWLGDVGRLDFGRSLLNDEPVLDLVLSSFGVTAYVVLLATALSALLAVPAGIYAAWRQNRAADTAITTIAIVALSVPSFWLSILLILFFGVKLGWLPTVGYVPPTEDLGASVAFIVLPVLALTLVQAGTVLRMARAAAIDVLRLEYVTYARSKGLSDAAVLARHVFPNAFAPVLTIIGFILGSLLAGAAVVETVFTLPGLGRLLVDSITARDYPVVQGAVLFIALVYVAVNLAVDLIYPLLDPKVRLS